MRVTALNQFYRPSIAATAQLLTDLCEDLARSGHRVDVVATRGDYLGAGDRLPAHEHIAGVSVHRVRATSLGKATLVHRATDYATFYALATVALARAPKPDVVLALSTPPLIALVGLAIARARGARFVYWCQDVYPDVAVALGALQASSPIARALDVASRVILKNADAVVAIGENMARLLRERGARHVHVVHNWSDGDAIDPAKAPRDNGVRRELGVGDDDTLVLYAGNMGLAHDFRGVVGAIKRLQDREPNIRFGFVGDGVRRRELEQQLAPRVRFLPYQPRERLNELLCAADVHLVTMESSASGLVVPSKLYGAMAAGRPIIVCGPAGSEAADVVEAAACGACVAPGDGDALAEVLLRLALDASLRATWGARARATFEARFDRPAAVAAFERVISG